MGFLACFGYLALIGMLSNLVAALLPRRWFHCDHLPYRAWRWEKGGKVYNKLHIRKWKDKVPDMSRILPSMMQKRVTGEVTSAQIEALARETCVSEFTHNALLLLGLNCLSLWEGAGGVIITVIWVVLGNVPFILIQRYNRPRLLAMAQTLRLKNASPVLRVE